MSSVLRKDPENDENVSAEAQAPVMEKHQAKAIRAC
jgi:hypothetical protein